MTDGSDSFTYYKARHMVERGGFEPPKAEPADLQSAPFDRSGTSPQLFSKGIGVPIDLCLFK